MTHVHAPVLKTREEIAARAHDIHPVQFTTRAFLTTLTAVFIAAGWLAGRSWYVLVFVALWTASRLMWLGSCVRMGYTLGRKHTIVPNRE